MEITSHSWQRRDTTYMPLPKASNSRPAKGNTSQNPISVKLTTMNPHNTQRLKKNVSDPRQDRDRFGRSTNRHPETSGPCSRSTIVTLNCSAVKL
jgi:hypothetical protein